MENLNQNNSQLVNISKFYLLKELCHINLLVAYPIPDAMLELWAASIMELKPEITPFILKEIINEFKLGKIEYNPRKGIQNIFSAFREINATPIKML
jgi:hypothetical protein